MKTEKLDDVASESNHRIAVQSESSPFDQQSPSEASSETATASAHDQTSQNDKQLAPESASEQSHPIGERNASRTAFNHEQSKRESKSVIHDDAVSRSDHIAFTKESESELNVHEKPALVRARTRLPNLVIKLVESIKQTEYEKDINRRESNRTERETAIKPNEPEQLGNVI